MPTNYGKYRVIEKIGEGGLGVVYWAENNDLGDGPEDHTGE
jgi:hypothetical protein